MASISARLAVIGIGENGLTEPDQDANSALLELDKGLRSAKLGEQCEAIVRFSRLFERYPFPILINSACLKLSDVFRVGSNFLRVLVLQVVQQNEKHLDKILNIDEFVRRIYSVVYSNDPVARALTLRTLGSIAGIVAERKNIHHSIRNSLDSHDAVELKAAIYAAGRFASKSKNFASNISTKIAEMIQGLATPVAMKLRLLSVFQETHHDAEASALVRKLCIQLLPSYPSVKFVQVTLHTLTRLAAASVTTIPEEVDLLLQYLHEDLRCDVRFHALRDLKLLAQTGPHLFTENHVDAIVQFALITPNINLRIGTISVLIFLAKSVAVDKFQLMEGCKTLELCWECIYHEDATLASISVTLLSHLAVFVYRENIIMEVDLMTEVASSIETTLLLISNTTDQQGPKHNEALKTILKCIVRICDVNPDLCSQFMDTLDTLLMSSKHDVIILLCEVLCALGNRSAGILVSLQPELVNILVNFSNRTDEDVLKQSQGIVMMFTLMFQASIGQSKGLRDMTFALSVLEKVDMWSAFKIARQAARYGHHSFATQIFAGLSNRVSSEHFHFWLVGLWEISRAESFLCSDDDLESCLNQAIAHYVKAVAALKAATSPHHSQQFQYEYAHLRCEVLQAYLQLLYSCSCLVTSPPPAIAGSQAMTTRDDLLKCGKVVVQLRKSAKEFRLLADHYGTLYQSVFDADPKTLRNLQLLQQSCLLVAQAIEQISQYNQGVGLFSGIGDEDLQSIDDSRLTLENYRLMEACKNASNVIRNLSDSSDNRLIGRQKIDDIRKVSRELLLVPLCLPRFFFQGLQSTRIKLAVSPQPKASGEPNIIHHASNLAVKVEGVVQHGTRPGRFRKVSKVLLSVSSLLQSKTNPSADLKQPSDVNNMTQTVTLLNDYFQAQFLLSFPVAGLHAVTVQAAVIDEKELLWQTGPKITLNVKSHDDSAGQKSTQKAGTSRTIFQTRF